MRPAKSDPSRSFVPMMSGIRCARPVAERVERLLRQELAVDDRRQADGSRVLVGSPQREPGGRLGQQGRVGRVEHGGGILHRLALEVVVVDQSAERAHVLGRPLRGDLGQVDRVRGRALRDRTREEALRGGHGHEGRDRVRAGRLAEQRHVARVAAERADVAAHPLERGDLVSQAEVALERMPRRCVGAEVQPAQRAEPVVQADVHDAVSPRKRFALPRVLPRRADAVCAAVDEHHHRTTRHGLVGRGHVDAEAVLAPGKPRVRADELALPVLRGDRSEGRRVAHSGPGRCGLGCTEAPGTAGRGRVGDPPPHPHAITTDAAHGPRSVSTRRSSDVSSRNDMPEA